MYSDEICTVKVFAALGPGDIVDAHRRQMTSKTVDTETSITYSGQLLEFCRLRGIETLAISHHPRTDQLTDEKITVENRPMLKLSFHPAMILRAIYLAYRARRFGADYVLINSGSAHYFALAVFWLVGIPVAVDFHNTLWPAGYPEPGIAKKVIRKLDGYFFRWCCAGAIGVSEECGRQLEQSAKRAIPFFDYKAQFRAQEFSVAPRIGADCFRVAFVGRVEENKGALDLVSIAEILRAHPVAIDVCGDGPSLQKLKMQVRERGLESSVTIHGALKRVELLSIYRSADAVVIPTRTDFAEGMPKVCAEAVLFHVPIITSKLSNAFDCLGPAIVEAQPGQPDSYAAAILSLLNDPGTRQRIKDACVDLSRQFFDRDKSLAAAFGRLLSATTSWREQGDYRSVFAKLD